MRRLFAILVMFVAGITASFGQRYYDDRHFYDEEFDWHWDIRLRISDGENNGLLTRGEANRLYKRLERIERKEYAYMADGRYDVWEQNDIWNDVVWLNRRVGIELYDYDRRFYGFGNVYISFNMYPFWYNRWYANGWDFYRYDRIGWGSWRYGYVPTYYVPRNNVYVYNHIHKNYNNNNSSNGGRSRYDNRSNENVIRRDRTDPANRVNNSSTRRTTSATPSPDTRRTYEPAGNNASGRSGSSSGTVTPRANGSSSSRSSESMRSTTPSTRSNSSGASSESRSSESMRATTPPPRSNSSSAGSSRSSESMRSATPARSNSSSGVSSSPSRNSGSSSNVRSSSPSSGRSSSPATSGSSGSSSSSSGSSSGSSRSSRN